MDTERETIRLRLNKRYKHSLSNKMRFVAIDYDGLGFAYGNMPEFIKEDREWETSGVYAILGVVGLPRGVSAHEALFRLEDVIWTRDQWIRADKIKPREDSHALSRLVLLITCTAWGSSICQTTGHYDHENEMWRKGVGAKRMQEDRRVLFWRDLRNDIPDDLDEAIQDILTQEEEDAD